MINKVIGLLVVLIIIISNVNARIHKLQIRGDSRRYIALTTFGFYQGGLLSVNMTNFRMSNFDENAVYGFSLDRTLSDAMNPYLDRHQEKCLLNDIPDPKYDFLVDSMDESSVIYLTMDFKKNLMRVNCSQNIKSLHIYSKMPTLTSYRAKRSSQINNSSLALKNKRDTDSHEMQDVNGEQDVKGEQDVNGEQDLNEEQDVCSNINLPIDVKTINNVKYFNTTFHMYVDNEDEVGLYNLFFHSCPNYNYNYEDRTYIDFTMNIQERNGLNFLSAGEMPLPSLYFMMSILFFTSGCTWIYVLKKSQHPVFKIHYLMAVLVFLKSLSLLFHGINFHFIQTKGEHVAAWAILYYITHLLKGAVLFITIVLVGTGWDFIKHILADKDKKIFMIVIPLQVLANVAEIIIEESEEGDIEHKTWKDVFILVDLLCCGAILFPVAWSIRHLQESANTDGKAAINLQKLKLFRHFYIMIVCYIYFTRIIVYLLKMTVPFQYEWLDELFRETATYIFFALTGYKFRPASANPYFTVNDDISPNDDDDEMDVVLSGGSGITEGLGKVTRIIRPTTSEITMDHEERDSLINKREASYDYD